MNSLEMAMGVCDDSTDAIEIFSISSLIIYNPLNA